LTICVVFPYPLQVHGVNAGAANATLSLAEALSGRGHDVCVYHPGVHFAEELRGPVLFRQYTRETRVEVVADLVMFVLVDNRRRDIGYFKLVASTKRSIVYHNAVFNRSDKGLMNFFRRWPDVFFVVSNFPARQARLLGIKNVEILPNGVSEVFRRSVHGRLESRRNTYLFVGALVKAKGVDRLLPAFREFNKHVPVARLLLAGTSKIWFQNQSEIPADNAGQIMFLGDVLSEDLVEVYRSAEFVVLPSEMESCGLAVMDGMWFGCIPIVSSAGALPELVHAGTNGIVIDEITVEGVMRGLLASAKLSAGERRVMSEAAHESVENRTWAQTATDLERIASRLARRRGWLW
jgi:glycosyltransferase involved in cell wall biosynthesis